MEKTQRLEIFLAMAQDRLSLKSAADCTRIESHKDENGILEDVELYPIGGTFFLTDLIVIVEALQLGCWADVCDEEIRFHIF